jgi:hypothetical protein
MQKAISVAIGMPAPDWFAVPKFKRINIVAGIIIRQ